MAQTQASIADHLSTGGYSSQQDAGAASFTYSRSSTMDNDVDMQGPSPRLSPRAHGIAHASDRSGAQACDPSHWNDAQDNGGRLYSNGAMDFDPDAYGSPTAKNKGNAADKGQSQLRRHPGWGLPQQLPVSQQSSGLSWHSAQGGDLIQGQGEGHTAETDRLEDVSSVDVQPTEARSATTAVEMEESTGAQLVSQTPAATVSGNIRRFDKTAYGDPSRKDPQKATTQPQTRRRPKTNPAKSPDGRRNSWPLVAAAPNDDPQASTHLPNPPLPNPCVNLNTSKNALKPTDCNTPLPKMSDDQEPHLRTTSSRNDSTNKPATPRPETFETLKQGNETPEQLIARLQAKGTRDVFQRVKRKDQGEVPTTTALALLDLLRKSLPPDSPEPQPDASNNGTRRKPLPNIDPTPSRNQLSHDPVQRTDHLLAEVREANKDQRHWVQEKKNPALWEQAAMYPGDDTSSIPVQKLVPLPKNVDLQEKTGGWDRPAMASDSNNATWDEGSARPAKEVPLPLIQHSQQGNADSWVPNQKPDKSARRTSRWASAADTRAPPVKPDSNAEGSEESESDGDSTRPMARGLGRLIRSRKPLVPEERLVGWDGQFLPPPTDWEFRPQFYNNTPEYISGFENWLGEVTVRTMSEKSVAELSFGVLPAEQVANLDNHPDGIGFAPRETVLSPSNSARYGHRLVKAIVQSPQNPTDFDGDAKLDLSDPDNARYKDETAQLYITRRMAQIKRVQREAEQKSKLPQVAECQQQSELDMAAETQGGTAPEIQESNEPPPPITTKNIYLRPAVQADAPGMMEIINWHIANGFRAPELAPISEDDMIERMRVSQHARLPFIVAVERARRTSRPKNRRYPRVNPNHPIQNIDPEYVGVTREELIVGWASASDWGAPDYCECITADLELYVAASCRKSGVGRCLMDALLDATDRGYMKKGGYEFRVAPEMKHLYSGGGGRDLHKLIFQVRSFNQPVQPRQMGKVLHAATKSVRLDDREDDYEVWLKDWLESYNFEQEACMKKVGTKHNRFMDVRYLTRETCWQPSDGRIPDYTNGY